jgi:hypothetical protein
MSIVISRTLPPAPRVIPSDGSTHLVFFAFRRSDAQTVNVEYKLSDLNYTFIEGGQPVNPIVEQVFLERDNTKVPRKVSIRRLGGSDPAAIDVDVFVSDGDGRKTTFWSVTIR